MAAKHGHRLDLVDQLLRKLQLDTKAFPHEKAIENQQKRIRIAGLFIPIPESCKRFLCGSHAVDAALSIVHAAAPHGAHQEARGKAGGAARLFTPRS